MSYKISGIRNQNRTLETKTSSRITEIQQKCSTCFVSNPIACKEICELWKLKQEYGTLRKEIPEKTSVSAFITTASNPTNFKILKTLSEGSSDIQCLRRVLGASIEKTEITKSLETLVKLGLVKVEKENYNITTIGDDALNSLKEYASLELQKIDALNENMIRLLAQGAETMDELGKDMPRTDLMRSLEELRIHGVIEKTNGRNKILYFATKKRPTRRLSSAELTIFKNIPKQGISAQELGKKLDFTIPSVYRHLRLLRYKRHVVRGKQSLTFKLTPIGTQIAEALEKVEKAIQGLSSQAIA